MFSLNIALNYIVIVEMMFSLKFYRCFGLNFCCCCCFYIVAFVSGLSMLDCLLTYAWVNAFEYFDAPLFRSYVLSDIVVLEVLISIMPENQI